MSQECKFIGDSCFSCLTFESFEENVMMDIKHGNETIQRPIALYYVSTDINTNIKTRNAVPYLFKDEKFAIGADGDYYIYRVIS